MKNEPFPQLSCLHPEDHDHHALELPPDSIYAERRWLIWVVRLAAAVLIALLLFFILRHEMQRDARRNEANIEAAYRYMETHPFDEFAGLPPQDVYAKVDR